MMIAGLPKGLVVAVVLIVGIIFFLVANPPHRPCTSKLEVFRELQAGKLFPGKGKVLARSPKILQQIENCKFGNSPGACFELFLTLRGLIRDLQSLPQECSEDIREVGEIRGSLREGMSLLVQIAWGETPPEKGMGPVQQGWLEAADLALFCSLKDMYVRFFGKEEMDQLKMAIMTKLPGEPAVIADGKCANCEVRKNALQVLSPEDAWSRTLFSLRCELFR
jgi:hypothetical protein